MAADTGNDDTGAASATSELSKPEWLRHIDERWLGVDEDTPLGRPRDDLEYILAGMVKGYLLRDDTEAAAEFARRFDDLYATVYEPRFNGYKVNKKGWTAYLIAFYDVLFEVAIHVRYDDPKQDQIVQLLLELRKFPPRAVKLFVQGEFAWVDSEVWTRDPLLPSALHTAEPYDEPDIDNYNLEVPEEADMFKTDSAQWVDFHAFQARCTAADLNKTYKYRFTSIGAAISVGLQERYPSTLDTKLDCHIMAAAQYILLAGDVIDAECVKKELPQHRGPDWKGWWDGNARKVWRQWGNRFGEIATALESGSDPGVRVFEENKEALKDLVIKARDKMVALEPEIFAQPDPNPDPAPSAETPDPDPEPSPGGGGGPDPTQTAGSGSDPGPPSSAEGPRRPQSLRSMLGYLKSKFGR